MKSTQHNLVTRLIMLAYREMPDFLTVVFSPRELGNGSQLGAGRQANGCVFSCGILIDIQIIIAAGDLQYVVESFAFQELRPTVCKVPTYTHVRHLQQGKRQVLYGGHKCFKPNELVEHAW